MNQVQHDREIMQDAFQDGYHVQYAHLNTAAKHIHTNVLAFEDFGRQILLAVLHREDFPLLRASQSALASADAGPLLAAADGPR